jgi:hypothetical protein
MSGFWQRRRKARLAKQFAADALHPQADSVTLVQRKLDLLGYQSPKHLATHGHTQGISLKGIPLYRHVKRATRSTRYR